MKKLLGMLVLISTSVFAARGDRALGRAYDLVLESLELNETAISQLDEQNQKLSKALDKLERAMDAPRKVEPIIVEKTLNLRVKQCELDGLFTRDKLNEVRREAASKCSAMWRIDKKICFNLITTLPVKQGACTETNRTWGVAPDYCYKKECTLAVRVDAPL